MRQPLSYARALISTMVVATDFFLKVRCCLWKIKPNIYTDASVQCRQDRSDDCPQTWHHVYSVTSAERGHTHTVLSSISANGFVLPCCTIYPQKRTVPENFREGAAAGTLFCNSENGWINSEVFLQWFNLFVKNILPARPVIPIQDGHASHVSIPLIEAVHANDVHILCLPVHTTHFSLWMWGYLSQSMLNVSHPTPWPCYY